MAIIGQIWHRAKIDFTLYSVCMYQQHIVPDYCTKYEKNQPILLCNISTIIQKLCKNGHNYSSLAQGQMLFTCIISTWFRIMVCSKFEQNQHILLLDITNKQNMKNGQNYNLEQTNSNLYAWSDHGTWSHCTNRDENPSSHYGGMHEYRQTDGQNVFYSIWLCIIITINPPPPTPLHLCSVHLILFHLC